jgi:DHA1 family tetracycline resistance protein-like MFS transporter
MTHSTHIAIYMGILASLYAAMQFIFSPLLGALSDRWGRRPVLLISLAGSAINYLFLTFSHSLILLLVGRILLESPVPTWLLQVLTLSMFLKKITAQNILV